MKAITNTQKGALGEKYTCKFLRKKGFKILSRNHRNKYSEIDIIAENKEYIVFVEVKTRIHIDSVRPADSVDFNKQQKILKAAKHYLSYTHNTKKQPRFDVAEVMLNNRNKCADICYIENAFSQGGGYAIF